MVNTGKREFKREIKLFDAVMLVAGTMIGSGIFIVSADIARNVGSAGWLLVVWLVAGLITFIGALSYGELTSMMPKAGGQYVFLKEAYDPLTAFLYGWTLFLVIQTGTIAAVAVAFAKFSGVFFPYFSDENALFAFNSFKITTQQVLAIFIIVLLTVFNIYGVKNGKLIQNIFGATKILALILLILFGFFYANESTIAINFTDPWKAAHVDNGEIFGWTLVTTLGVAMVGALFSSDAWNNITFAGDEVINPKKTIPLSLALGTSLVTVIYILANLIYLLVLPLRGNPDALEVVGKGIQFAANQRVAVAVAEAINPNIATAITILIMISTFSCVNGLVLSGARVYYKMAEDGLFFKPIGRLNAKGVPAVALVLQCIWGALLCISGSYNNLLDYVIFDVLLFYILTIAGIFILRKKQPQVPRPYKAFGYPVLPALYILLASSICLILLIFKPEYTWPGFIIVGIGIPFYYLFKNLINP
jgi:basic amino acid/polyamine antiporter, APA family